MIQEEEVSKYIQANLTFLALSSEINKEAERDENTPQKEPDAREESLSVLQEEPSQSRNPVISVDYLNLPELQNLHVDGRKFDHIFVLGVHELIEKYDDLWYQDLLCLHRGHSEGYLWFFSSKHELPGKWDAELNCPYGSRGKNYPSKHIFIFTQKILSAL